MSSDYVIVGAGLTGTALAVRLSENPSVTVTILEAGSAPSHDENIDIPGNFVNNLGNPAQDWAFFTTPQEHLDGRPVFLPRGKNIGGSSLLNFMQYNRASDVEYNDIEKLGIQTWSWGDLIPYFKKSENLKYDEQYAAKYGYKFDSEYHGTSGPLQTRVPTYFNPATLPWIETVKGLGIKHNPDPAAGDITGTWTQLCTVDDKSMRSSAASAYYEPNQSRPNLKVITGALATKVLTSGNDIVVATGVEYLKDGVLQTIHASKEVILSAGSYKTPQILELSGLGDPEILKKYGINIVVDLPGVGNNLRMLIANVHICLLTLTVSLEDHFMVTYTAKLKPGLGLETWAKMEDPAFAHKQVEELLKKPQLPSKTNGSGLLASPTPAAYAFLPLKDFDKDGKIAELAEKLSLPNTPTFRLQKEWVKNDRVPFLELAGYDRFIPGTLAAPEPGAEYMSSSVISLHPFSVGSVHILSNDSNTPPAIDHNYLDNEFDIKLLIEGYRLTRKIFNSAPLKDLIQEEVSPGPNFQTDEEITEYIKKVLATTFHPVGTASLLPRKDGGVVDARLKVYGTKNLRVADASVIPIQIGAHPQATLYALAEKLADIIKEDAQT